MSTYYCRLCFVNNKPEDSLLFSTYITEMIQFIIPELDMKLINNPILCAECYDKLEQVVKFKRKCLEVQDNLKQMLSSKGVSEGVDLSTLITNKCIASSSVPNKETLTDECDSENTVALDNKVVEHSIILNGSSLVDTSDQFKDLSVSSVNIKSEPDISTSIACDTGNLNDTSPERKRRRKSVAPVQSPSQKLSTVKNVVDVKFEQKYCQTCKLPFNSLAELIQHLYSNHQMEGELYSCLICRYKSSTLRSILGHYNNSHSKCVDLRASCFFCMSDMKNFDELFTHMIEKHTSICKTSRYFCNSCNFITKSYVNFRKHYFQSHDLICNYCLKYCDNICILNRHLRSHFSNSKRRSIAES